MTKEDIIKELISSKYGSVLKFSEATGIPYSSIRNIFSRGMESLSVGTAVQICKALGIDIEDLMDGKLSVRPNYQVKEIVREYQNKKKPPAPLKYDTGELTDQERSRLSISMAQMNKQGRERVVEYAEDLAAGGRYAKVPLTISGQKNMAAARSGDRVAVASVSAEDEEAALPAPSHSVDI